MDKREIKSDGLAFKLLEEMLYISYVVIGYYLSFMLRYRMNPDIFNLQPFYDYVFGSKVVKKDSLFMDLIYLV